MLSGFVLFSAHFRWPEEDGAMEYVMRSSVTINPLAAVSLLPAFALARSHHTEPDLAILVAQSFLLRKLRPQLAHRSALGAPGRGDGSPGAHLCPEHHLLSCFGGKKDRRCRRRGVGQRGAGAGRRRREALPPPPFSVVRLPDRPARRPERPGRRGPLRFGSRCRRRRPRRNGRRRRDEWREHDREQRLPAGNEQRRRPQ